MTGHLDSALPGVADRGDLLLSPRNGRPSGAAATTRVDPRYRRARQIAVALGTVVVLVLAGVSLWLVSAAIVGDPWTGPVPLTPQPGWP